MQSARSRGHHHPSRPEAGENGFGLVQLTIAMVVLIVGVLGLVSSMVGSQLLARSAKEVNLANIAMVSAIEEFRYMCATNFNTACADFAAGKALALPEGLMDGATLTARVITDESELSPSLDIDGNGSKGDVITNVSTLEVAVLEISVDWPSPAGTNYRLVYVSMIPRAEYEDTQIAASDASDPANPADPLDPGPLPPVIPDSTFVHNQAEIADGAVIGSDSSYEQQCSIGTGTTIGDRATVKKFVTIGTSCTIGTDFTVKDRTVIGNDVTIGDGVTIDKDVQVGDGATILSGANVRRDTVIPPGATYP